MAINFEQLLKPQAACGHATPRPGQWPKPSAVQWQKPIPGMGHAVDGNWLSALVSRPARRPWAATLSRGKSMGGLRCRVRVFLNRRQRPFCLVKQAVWQCNTGRLAASYGPFPQQAVAQWVGHDGATAVNHAPAQCPPVGLDAACEPLAVASRAKHSPSQAMRAPAFIHYISTITHHRLHSLAVVLHPAMSRHSPQRLRLWRQPAWLAIYCGRFSLFFNKL